MYKDINGRHGFRDMQGTNFLYGNLKLLTKNELLKALNDGIEVIVKNKHIVKEETKAEELIREKANKSSLVREAFATVENNPVTDSNSVTWNGGFTSAMRLDAALRLSENMGLTAITFYDIDNQPHQFTKGQAVLVINTVATKYSSTYGLKQSTMNKIANAKSLTTLNKIDIPWNVETI